MARSLPVYNTGTCQVSELAGVWTVGGTGTQFLTPDGVSGYTVLAGDMFVIPGNGFGTIAAVTLANALTLDNWTGTAASPGTQFKIYRFEGLPSSAVAALVSNLLALGAYGRTPVADSNYSAVFSDRSIAYTSITAPRVVTLPPSAQFPAGAMFTVFDESGSCSGAATITVAGAGSDVVHGIPIVIQHGYGFISLQTNALGTWTVVGGDVASALEAFFSTAPTSLPAYHERLWLNSDVVTFYP
jgi:hypothetical protein